MFAALARAASAVPKAQIRSKGTSAPLDLKKTWLRDPAVYPLLAILGTAGALCTGFGVYFASTNPDVRVNKNLRQSLFR